MPALPLVADPRGLPIRLAKPSLAVAVAFTAVLSTTSGVGVAVAEELPPGGTFVDDDGNTHEGYIEAIAREGVTNGCGEERYCPADDVTRGEMAAFLRRALDLPASSTDHFTDDDGHTFEDDINALADAGITNGCGDGTTFCVGDPVSREVMAAFLRRAGDLPASSTDHFSDDDGRAFEDDVNAVADAGITMGCGDGRYCPRGRTSRAQMAAFLGRFLGLESTPPPPRSEMSVEQAIREWFPDVFDEAWIIADCESNHDPRAVNPNGTGYHGLFQIGEYYHRSAFEQVTGQRWEDAIYVAYYNAQYARDLYDRSGGWGPWECRHQL